MPKHLRFHTAKSFLESFVVKYKPKSLKEFINQEEAVNTAKQWISRFKHGKSFKEKPLLLHGPPGVGKTALAYALAADYNLEIFELNASDSRDAKTVKKLLGAAMNQKSFFHRGKLLLIDEVDGISKKDYGGLQTLLKLIKTSNFPIILTANNIWDKRFSSLRQQCRLLQLKKLSVSNVYKTLVSICKKENLEFDNDAVRMLARNSSGDLRAALLDLQSLSHAKIKASSVESLGFREREQEIFLALVRVLKTMDANKALGAFDNVEMELSDIILWLDRNIPLEYKDIVDIAKAYDALSMADVFLSRIRRWQYYRLMVYASVLLTAGVALAKKEKYHGFTKYQKPDRVLKLWIAKQKLAKKKALAHKMSEKLHTSSKHVFSDVLPYFHKALEKPDFRKLIARWLDLNIQELP